jgi:hypothetical protein
MKIDENDNSFIGIDEITFTGVPWNRKVFDVITSLVSMR